MGSPQDAALRHRQSSIRSAIQFFETDLITLSPVARPDIELLIKFFKDAEQTAKNEIELYGLTNGGIEARKQACAHPERYISKAPAPPTEISSNRGPQRPRPSHEELIAWKTAELEAEFRKAQARSSELKKTIEDWYLQAFPEWEKVTADARGHWSNRYPLAMEQFGALKLLVQIYSSQPTEKREQRAVPTPKPNAPGSPFKWSEIHSDAEDRIGALESAIETEIRESIEPVPQTGAARHQFFVLLEERANEWAGRGLRAYLDCLEQVGRGNAQDAKTAIWKNGLLFFTSDSISRLMYLACGIGEKERGWITLRYPSGPAPHVALLQDASNRIWNIGIRVKDRTYRELFGLETCGWFEETRKLLQQLGQNAATLPTPQIATVHPGEPPAQPFHGTGPEARNVAPVQHPHPNSSREPEPQESSFWVAEDCRSVHFDGSTHALTSTQGQMMKVLYEAHQSDRPVVSKRKLLGVIERETSEIRDTWRDSPLWNTLIVSAEKRGTYRLSVPTKAELAREKSVPAEIPGKYRDSTGHLPDIGN